MEIMTTCKSLPFWLTFSCRDGSEKGSWGSFQSWKPMGPFLGQVDGWGNVPWASDRGDTLAIWFCIRFGCILSRTRFRTSCPETKTFLSIGRWCGCDPRNASRFLPGLAGSRLWGAVLFRGVRGEWLDAPHGGADRAAAIGVTWAGAEERTERGLCVENGTTLTHPLTNSHTPLVTWPPWSDGPWLHMENCPQHWRKDLKHAFELGECISQYCSREMFLYVPWPKEIVLLLKHEWADLNLDKICFWNRTHN